MINIREQKSEKVSGNTSLFVGLSKYNRDVIDRIKLADKRVYHEDTYEWELPVNCLAYLLDNLTYFDDITLTLYLDKEPEEKLIRVVKYKSTPFPHQLEAVDYGLQKAQDQEGFLLLDQPGLGKSASAIYLAEEIKAHFDIKHCLIVCGVNSIKRNWQKEIRTHSNFTSRLVGEKTTKNGKSYYTSLKDRAAEIKHPTDDFFQIINIEMLRDDDVIKAIKSKSSGIDMIVIDEIHRCSPRSQQGKNTAKLQRIAYKLGLTGTLLTNSPISAYLPLKFIGAEKSTLTNFKSQYCEFGGFGNREIVGYKNIGILKDIIESHSLRRTKDLLNIPEKTIIEEYIEMSDSFKKFYTNIVEGVKDEFRKIKINADNVLALTTRLRQATACPSILTTSDIMSSKIERAIEITEDVISQGEKVVIMSMFKEPVYQLEKLLSQYNPLIGTGDLPDELVAQNNELFQENSEYKVFIGTIDKCGTGLTFNAATYLIAIDTPWTWALFEQVTDRIHRVTNKKPVFIYELITKDTVDEAVHGILQTKKALSDFIIDNKVDDSTLDTLKNYIWSL